jgi:hypothetical protein
LALVVVTEMVSRLGGRRAKRPVDGGNEVMTLEWFLDEGNGPGRFGPRLGIRLVGGFKWIARGSPRAGKRRTLSNLA